MPIRNRLRNIRHLLWQATIALALVALDKGLAKEAATLRGVGLPESETFEGIHTSFAGGAEIVISGYNFTDSPIANQIYLSTNKISSTTMKLTSTPLTENNEFSSRPIEGKLTYTIPKFSDLFNGLTLESFTSFGQIPAELSVTNTESGDSLICGTASQCTIRFSWNDTPRLHILIPPVVYKGINMTAYLDTKAAPDYYKGTGQHVDMRIDGTSLDYGDYTIGKTTLSSHRQLHISATVMSEDRNKDAIFTANFRGSGNQYNMTDDLTIYSLDGESSYSLKVYPAIESVSHSTGSAQGGQILTIKGSSLDGDTVSILVDGVECLPLTIEKEQLTCMTGKKESSSAAAPTYYIGQQGMKRYHFFDTNDVTIENWKDYIGTEEEDQKMLWTAPEVAFEELFSYTTNGFSSYFKAPASGDYRFYMACDDFCYLDMSIDDPTNPAAVQRLNLIESYMSFRDMWPLERGETDEGFGSVFSQWVTLTEGQHYYFETAHRNDGWAGHMTIGMEVKPDSPSGSHPMAETQIQRFSLAQSDFQMDTMRIIVTNPDQGTFVIMFLHPTDGSWVESNPITSGCDADAFKTAIEGFYTANYKVAPQVSLDFYNSDGVQTVQGAADATVYTYTIELPTVIEGQAVENVMIVPQTSTSIVEFVSSIDIQLSSPPLSGSYWIKCFDTDGNWYSTQDIKIDNSDFNTVRHRIINDCSFLKDKVNVEHITTNFVSNAMGLEVQLDLFGMNGALNNFEMISSADDPIVGANVAYLTESTRPYGESIIFPVVPPEYFFTNEDVPQVIVQVDDFPVLCGSLECGFTYTEPASLITAFSVSGLDVTITGTSLPLEITSVTIARIGCTIDSENQPSTSTEIKCSLTQSLPAGSWLPQVKDEYGLIKIDASVSTLDLSVVITDISPSTNLNPAGGDILTITGENFPASTENSAEVSLSLMLNANTRCVPITMTSTQITCETESLLKAGRRLQDVLPSTFGMTFTLVTDSYDLTTEYDGFSANSDPYTTEGISPEKISPIALRTIDIQLSENYPEAGMTKEDFSVTLVPASLEMTYLTINNDGIRPLNVIGVDASSKTITVKYGGAYSGTYGIVIKSTTNGNIDTTATQLQAVFEIDSFEPTTGSIFGGTAVTVYGGPFTDDINDTFIKVGFNWWEGIDNYCYVFESTEEYVRCRLPLDLNREAKDYQLIAISATLEEANCNFGDCLFTYIAASDLPEVTSFSSAFDTASSKYRITILGTGFTDTADQIEFMLADKAQNVLSATSTNVVIEVDGLKSGLTSNKMDLFFSVGIPNGYTTLLDGVTFTPKLILLSSNTVSTAGSMIQATIAGAGVSDGLTLIDSATQTDLCLSATMTEYSVLECELDPSFDYAAGVSLSVKETNAGTVHACAASDSTACNLTLIASQPSFSAVEKISSTQMRITGSLFPTSGYSCIVSYANADSDSCQINSASEVIADFTKGIPIQETDISPVLSFVADSTTFTHNAVAGAVIANPFTLSSATSGLTSSFAGGRMLTVEAEGLSQKVIQGDAEVRVCSKPCQIQEDSSDSTQFTCKVPAIATKRSNELFEIAPEGNMYGAKSIYNGMTDEDAASLYDQNVLPGISETSAECYIGVEFASGYVGVLEEVQFFLDYFSVDTIVGQLHVQASSDNFASDIVTLLVVGEEAHEGWNYYPMEDTEFYEENQEVPSFKYYRLYSISTEKGCDDLSEIRWIGQEVINDSADAYNCEVELVSKSVDASTMDMVETVIDLGVTVGYETSSTPRLTDIWPMYGAVEGNDEVTFTGEDFPQLDISDYSILIDDRECSVTSVTTTEIKCTTAPRIGAWEQDPKLEFSISGYGNVATQGLVYRYCSAWSQESTWGYLFLPVDGESVAVPKGLCLLVDIDNSPKLKLVQVDGGTIIFPPSEDPNHHRTFDAHYIMINNGTMIVGTEDHPYTSKLTITMHGSKDDHAMPIYGKKSIGVRFGTLDMHGVTKKSWTDLDSTISPGQKTLTLVEIVDWEVGDLIMVTSTSYDQWEAELKTVVSIDNSSGSKSVVTVDSAYEYKHVAGVETLGDQGDTLTIRAEVALMSHNIVYRGDPETSAPNKFGAHIMLHSPGNESVIGRIENVQFNDVGQAFLLGKYPIHFHMIGRVTKSYARNNAINRSYNRGTTIHGVHYLRVSRNTYYDVMGHTIFVEDAAETKNLIEYNVIAGTKPSHSLLNTDQSPGCFWITHPDNIFVGNRAAGSTNYGFWMDYQETAMGPSFDPNIKPIFAKLGEFRNNVAHSIGHYGLRIFHGHTPPVTAVYEDHLSYSCGKNGIMSGEVGLVSFRNITVSDNKKYGFQIERIVDGEKDENNIIGAVVVGSSSLLGGSTQIGLVGPQSSLWKVSNARFYHFTDGAGGIGDCSNCEEPKGDSGARTYRFEQSYYDPATVTQLVQWLVPFKGIIHDIDGTLTGQGPDSYITAYWKHNEWPECTTDIDMYSGIVCPHPWSVRRIVFYAPVGDISRQHLFLWQQDDDVIASMTEDELSRYYIVDNGSTVPFKEKESPMYHWTVPYVTGHKYYARWAHGLDFQSLKVEIEPWLWDNDNDGDVYFVLPHFESRGQVLFETSAGFQANNTLNTLSPEEYVMGSNAVYNATETREIHFVINGKDGSDVLEMTGSNCLDDCEEVLVEVEEGAIDEDQVALWSNPASWPNLGDRIPLEGEDVLITSSMNIIYDLGESPLFKSIEINGQLTFKQGEPAVLNTYALWVRAGTLNIGTESEPFDSTAEIRLHGNNTSPSEFVFSPQIQVSNKNFIITGNVYMYGKHRNGSTRLLESAYPGEDKLILPRDLDWRAGDYLGLAATNMDPRNSETVQILDYEASSGVATLQQEMTGYHFGAQKSTGSDYSGVDMRAEVMLLSRDINITASTDGASKTADHPEPWGCRVLVSDFFEPSDMTYRKGSFIMDNVSIFNCSQTLTKNAALKFDNAIMGTKVFTNGAISSGAGEGVHLKNSRMVTIKDTVIHDFVLQGLTAKGSTSFTLENNIVNQIRPDSTPLADLPLLEWPFPTGGYNMIGAGSGTYTFKNNTAASMWHSGFQLPSKKCGTSDGIKDNIAHSISGIGVLVISSSGDCSEFSDLMGYKNALPTLQLSVLGKNIARRIISIDSAIGIHVGGTKGNAVEVRDNIIYGSKGMENSDCPTGPCYCPPRTGVMAPTFGGGPDRMKNTLSIAKMFKGGGGWGGESLFIDNTFIGFDNPQSACWGRQSAIGTNPKHADYHPMAHFRRNKFVDQDVNALFYMTSPNWDWIGPADCGTFVCTGLFNAVFKVSELSFSGTPYVSGLPSEFTVTANNYQSVSSKVVPTCVFKDKWNALLCQEENIGVLLFESQDEDRMDRSSQPVYLKDEGRGFENRLNAYMDHSWDGAYSGQKREQRFPTFVDASRNYTIEYTGTPPQKQKFSYYNDLGTSGFMLTIKYPNAGTFQIYNEQKELVNPTDWDYDTDQWTKPQGKFCGENRYLGVFNVLQFWIEPGCTLYVHPRNAIMLAVRMEWDVKSFFEEKSIGRFTDRMAAQLGVHRADLKIVQVYEGSVVVTFQVFAEEDDPKPESTLQKVSQKFEDVVPQLGMELGAPVISIQTAEGQVKTMDGYEDYYSENQVNDGFNGLIDEFIKELEEKHSQQDQTVDQEASTTSSSQSTEEITSTQDSNSSESSSESSPETSSEVSSNDQITENEDKDQVSAETDPVNTFVTVSVETTVTSEESLSDDESKTESVIIISALVVVIGVITLLICFLTKILKKKRDPRIMVSDQVAEVEHKTGRQPVHDNIVLAVDEMKENSQYRPNSKGFYMDTVVTTKRRPTGLSRSGTGTAMNSERGADTQQDRSARHEDTQSAIIVGNAPVPIEVVDSPENAANVASETGFHEEPDGAIHAARARGRQ